MNRLIKFRVWKKTTNYKAIENKLRERCIEYDWFGGDDKESNIEYTKEQDKLVPQFTTGKMHYPAFFECDGYTIGWTTRGHIDMGSCGEKDNTECKDAVLMQYTGVKDKNGKEIFEGDILECSNVDDEYLSPAIVAWGCYDEAQWSLWYQPKEPGPHQDGLKADFNGIIAYEEYPIFIEGRYEVLGNIYENPELMKVSL